MDENELQSEIVKLLGEIGTATKAQEDKPEKPISKMGIQESLNLLRLGIKYLMFDLEATRGENMYLRRMLEESSGGGEVSEGA